VRWRPEPTLARRILAAFFALVSLALSYRPAAADEAVVSGYGQQIQFAGYAWQVKISNVLVGPGPNLFSDDQDSVSVDASGNLHLNIRETPDGAWQSAEVVLQRSLGYGTYCFVTEPINRPLDPNVVLGLFTWTDNPDESHRELDIELSQWGEAGAPDGRYSVQPYLLPEHMHSFVAGDGTAPVTHCMQWTAGRVAFSSWQSRDGVPLPENVVGAHVFTDGIPDPGDEQVRMNLWLLDGHAPTDGQPLAVVISGFRFTPEASAADHA
jgi:hypothetical protein